MTHRSNATLADGRELFYYDREPGRDRSVTDGRAGMPPVASTAETRWDPLFADFTAIAGHRQTRTFLPPDDECPLCPSRDGRHTEIPAPDYEVAVFENRFPAFSTSSLDTVPTVATPPFRSGPGAGRCEVVCFSDAHDTTFSQLSIAQARTVVDAWADRTTALSAIDTVEFVLCFENRGEEIGVTLRHPHGQIYGYPFVPPRFAVAARSARAHLERTGRCLQCELLDAELDAGERIVRETAHWVAYVPFAARWPYEVRIVPRDHVADLPALDDTRRDELASFYVDVLGRFDALFPTPAPYIAAWQQAPVRGGGDAWHLAAEVFTIRRSADKLKYLAGSESAAAVWINDVRPEDAAAALRAARIS